MELLNTHLTANPSPQESVGLLEVNERLHGLAGRLKERRPEDVAEALKLVQEYGSLVADNRSFEDREFERIQKLLPEAKIERVRLQIGGKTASQLLKDLEVKHVKVDHNVKQMMLGSEFVISELPETVDLVEIKVEDLSPNKFTMKDVFDRMRDLGLTWCPEEAGPYLRLSKLYNLGENRHVIGSDRLTGQFGEKFFLTVVDGDARQNYDAFLMAERWSASKMLCTNDVMVFRLKSS